MKITEHPLRFQSAAQILDGYLASAPLAHALFRAAETGPLCPLALSRPVLDLGCGAGEFAGLALMGKIDVGIDLAARQLAAARSTRCYARLVSADARRLPFADGSFRCVVSVSVLEHVPQPELVLSEVARVLRPGGQFLGTVVLADLHQHLCYPALLRRLGLAALARQYVRWHDTCFGHRTLLSRGAWESLLRGSGLEVTLSRPVVSPRLTRWWDALLPLALPYRLLGRLGRACHWRPRWWRSLVRDLCSRLLADEGTAGSVLAFCARKPPAPNIMTARAPAARSKPVLQTV
jgi:SAM-dependent methyltransferase